MQSLHQSLATPIFEAKGFIYNGKRRQQTNRHARGKLSHTHNKDIWTGHVTVHNIQESLREKINHFFHHQEYILNCCSKYFPLHWRKHRHRE